MHHFSCCEEPLQDLYLWRNLGREQTDEVFLSIQKFLLAKVVLRLKIAQMHMKVTIDFFQ